ILAGVLGAIEPPTLTWVGPWVSWMLGVVMFGMGMTLTVDDFRAVLSHPVEVLIGVVAQFTIMPLIAWVLTIIFGLPPELAIGIILVGACPGGTASNVISYLARGDVALSVSMTMTTTLLAPIVTPSLTYFLAGAWIDISLTSMMISIAQMVLAPVLLGVAANHFFTGYTTKIQPVLPVISVIAIVLLVGGVVALSAEKLATVGPLMAMIVILHNAFGLLLGYVLARLFHLDSKKSRTIAIEVGMQNSGLAASLAIIYFSPAAAIPGAIFSVWHNVSGSLLANFFVKRETNENNHLTA
ncbi:MAG: bile acid:sodium symporter family protein, partial [Selenomonadaceae bacterium]|nr:bile acid:sodium symporter family protein [Selenomonadaceae bacterium]